MRLGLLPPAQRPTLDEARPAPFRKADVDDIEVPRDDRLRKNDPRLTGDLGPEIPIREVREGQHLHSRRLREPCSTGRGRVQRLVGPLLLLGGKGRLVDENVRLPCHVEHFARGTRIPGQDDLSPGPRRAQHLVGHDLRTGRQVDCLSVLQPPEERPLGNAERTRCPDVEAPGTGILGEAVAVGGHAVLDGERKYPVVVALDALARA